MKIYLTGQSCFCSIKNISIFDSGRWGVKQAPSPSQCRKNASVVVPHFEGLVKRETITHHNNVLLQLGLLHFAMMYVIISYIAR